MSVFISFYVQPIIKSLIEVFAFYIIWVLLLLPDRKTIVKIKNVILCLISIGLIICLTLVNRLESNEISLIPFISFVYAQSEPEYYRTMLMNVFLFIPLGMGLPFVLPSRMNRKILIAVLVGALLSLLIEIVQYIFCIGRCETDDVIMNTIGTFIGTTSFWIHKKIKTIIKSKRDI